MGGPPLKTRRSRRSCHEKVKKTLHRSVTRLHFAAIYLKRAKMNPSPDPPDPADPMDPADPGDPVHGLLLGTSRPHAPGVRMTVVNNSLKLLIF